MDIRTFYSTLTVSQRDEMAVACDTTVGHLRNVAYGKTCGEALAMKIEAFTTGIVTCEELRPDLIEQWAYLRNTPAQALPPGDTESTVFPTTQIQEAA